VQAASQYLIKHSPDGGHEKPWFQLKPDFLLTHLGLNTVMDAKWKLLDSTKNTTSDKYGIDQADLYQLFAYGQKYQNGHGHMLLIYPTHSGFKEPLPKLSFSEDLHLWCVPFDIHRKHLVTGQWTGFFPALAQGETSEQDSFLNEMLESIEDVTRVLGGKAGSDLSQLLKLHVGVEGELTLIPENAGIHRNHGDQFNDWSDRDRVVGFSYDITDPVSNRSVGTGMLLFPFRTKPLLLRLENLQKRYDRVVSGAIPKNGEGLKTSMEEKFRLLGFTQGSKL
jgi:5-methylcytosine-specific restriction enzyme subunit McrC